MTKHELIRAAAKAAGVTQETAESILKAAFEAAAAALAAGEPIKINGFGTFEIKQRKPHTVYNFKTGETMQQPMANTISFSPAAALKQRVNERKEKI